MSDPYPYLLGGELLLTAGVHIPEAASSGTYFDDYVSRIIAAGGAALGFGVAPVHDSVPRALVAACDTYGLPLVEVPPRTTFSGVARAVWQLMARARHAELRRVTEAQQSLAAAASRPDPVRAVLRQLAQRVSGRAVLYGPAGTELAAFGRGPTPGALAGLAAVVRPDRGPGNRATSPDEPAPADAPQPTTPSPHPSTPTSATDTVDGTHLTAYALGTDHGFTLGIATPTATPATTRSPPSPPSSSPSSPANSAAARARPARPPSYGCSWAPRPRRWPLSWAEPPVGSSSTPTPPRTALPTPWPRPRSAPPWAPHWSTPTATSYASSSPPTARSPRSPAGRAG